MYIAKSFYDSIVDLVSWDFWVSVFLIDCVTRHGSTWLNLASFHDKYEISSHLQSKI